MATDPIPGPSPYTATMRRSPAAGLKAGGERPGIRLYAFVPPQYKEGVDTMLFHLPDTNYRPRPTAPQPGLGHTLPGIRLSGAPVA